MGNRRPRTLGERLDRIQEWTPEVERLAQENMARSEAILECQEKIRFYQSKLNQLQEEQREASLWTALRDEAWRIWPTLSKKERFTKKVILAALESKELPDELEDGEFEDAVPSRLINDRDIYLARLRRTDRSPSTPIRIPDRFLNDKDIVVETIRRCPYVLTDEAQEEAPIAPRLLDDEDVYEALLASKKDAVLQIILVMSERLRNQPHLMQQSLRTFETKGYYIGTNLLDDKEFLLSILEDPVCAAKVSLREVSERLRNDAQVVEAFVADHGLDLEYASTALRRHANVVRTALRQTPEAFRFVLMSKERTSLLNDRNFLLEIFPTEHTGCNKAIWEQLSTELQQDVDVAVSLVAEDTIDLISSRFGNNREFWSNLFARKGSFWGPHLPLNLRLDRELALLAAVHLDGEDGDVLKHMLALDDNWLLRHRDLIRRIASTDLIDDSQRFLASVPAGVLNEREFALELCRVSPAAYPFLSAERQEEYAVVRELILHHPTASYGYLPHFVQHMYPELIAEGIRIAPAEELDSIWGSFCTDLWGDRRVALAWLDRGRNLMEFFDFEEDEELMLALLKVVPDPGDYVIESKLLWDSKSFMLKACEINGVYVTEASSRLKGDFDLMLTAFSQRPDLPPFFVHKHADRTLLCNFAKQLRKEMEAHTGLLMVFLGMSKPGTTLSIMNQGTETTWGYMHLVAEYIGIPRGERLEKMRLASMSLAKWGY